MGECGPVFDETRRSVCIYIYTCRYRYSCGNIYIYIYIWSEREISLYSNGETDMYM